MQTSVMIGEQHGFQRPVDGTFVLSKSLFQRGYELAALADAELGVDGAEMISYRMLGNLQV